MPKGKRLPQWVKGLATKASYATITIDSMTAIRKNAVTGGLFSFDLLYYPPPNDRWGLDLLGHNIEAVRVNFTFKNNIGRAVTGVVGGVVDNIALTQVMVEDLANGGSVSGFVLFDRLLGEIGRIGEIGDPSDPRYGLPGTITANPLSDGRWISTGDHLLTLMFTESVAGPNNPTLVLATITTKVLSESA